MNADYYCTTVLCILRTTIEPTLLWLSNYPVLIFQSLLGDTEYIAAFQQIIMPVVYEVGHNFQLALLPLHLIPNLMWGQCTMTYASM